MRRAIADFYRRGQDRLTPELARGAEPTVPSHEGVVELLDAIARVMAPLRPEHRRVVEIVVLAGGTAADALRELPRMTEANVHQIASRFRRALRGELGAGANGAGWLLEKRGAHHGYLWEARRIRLKWHWDMPRRSQVRMPLGTIGASVTWGADSTSNA